MYIDLIIKIKNAAAARKSSLKVPFSKMDYSVAEVLKKNGYIKDVEKKGRMPKRILEIEPSFEGKKSIIRGVKFLSKPGRKLYAGYKELRPIKQGFGLLVLSTPKGIMTGGEARKMKLGGQLLFEIW